MPSTEIIFGRAFRVDQNEREPRYIAKDSDTENLSMCSTVYSPIATQVFCPYGGFLMEAKTGEGNLVGSTAPLLTFMDNYSVRTGAPMPVPDEDYGGKNGRLSGTSTMIRQDIDGFNIVVLFNENRWDDHLAWQMEAETRDLIDSPEASSIDWESLKCIDGFWVDCNRRSSGFGSYNDPFNTMDTTLSTITDGTKLRFKESNSNWSGTISTRTLIDAPFDTVIIGLTP